MREKKKPSLRATFNSLDARCKAIDEKVHGLWAGKRKLEEEMTVVQTKVVITEHLANGTWDFSELNEHQVVLVARAHTFEKLCKTLFKREQSSFYMNDPDWPWLKDITFYMDDNDLRVTIPIKSFRHARDLLGNFHVDLSQIHHDIAQHAKALSELEQMETTVKEVLEGKKAKKPAKRKGG